MIIFVGEKARGWTGAVNAHYESGRPVPRHMREYLRAMAKADQLELTRVLAACDASDVADPRPAKRRKEPTFDAHGYPTDETLEAIRTWPDDDLPGLIAFVRAAWHWPDFWREEDGKHVVSTGGWSGNESLIAALADHTIFWMMYWEESRRGGRYIFRTIEDWMKDECGGDSGNASQD